MEASQRKQKSVGLSDGVKLATIR